MHPPHLLPVTRHPGTFDVPPRAAAAFKGRGMTMMGWEAGGPGLGPGFEAWFQNPERTHEPWRGAVGRHGCRAGGWPGVGGSVCETRNGPMNRGAVRLGGMDAALGVGLVWEARFDKTRNGPMNRGAVWLGSMGAALGVGLVWEARFAKPGTDP